MENLTLVIPAKQEKESLPLVLKEIENFTCRKKIIVLKDDYETIEEAKKFETVEIMFQKKSGVGSAIIEGIESVQTKYFCIFMADGSTDPKFLQELYNKSVNDNLDFVFSSRYQKPGGGSDDDTLITLLGNFFFTTLGNVLFSLGISDILYNYVLGKTKSFSDLQSKSIDQKIRGELPRKAKGKKNNVGANPNYKKKKIDEKKKIF